jgi:hypothetical protein
MRNQKNRDNPKVKNRVRKERVFINSLRKIARIQNIPFNSSGYPDRSRAVIEDFGKVFKGWHTITQAVLFDERGFGYLRVVIA